MQKCYVTLNISEHFQMIFSLWVGSYCTLIWQNIYYLPALGYAAYATDLYFELPVSAYMTAILFGFLLICTLRVCALISLFCAQSLLEPKHQHLQVTRKFFHLWDILALGLGCCVRLRGTLCLHLGKQATVFKIINLIFSHFMSCHVWLWNVVT